MSNAILNNQLFTELQMQPKNEDNVNKADLHQRQKLESIGLLASSIAHDFNNLLIGVIGHLAVAQKKLGNEEEASASVGKAIHSAQKATQLVQYLLEFAAKGSKPSEWVDVNILIENSLPLLNLATTDVQLQYVFDESLPPVYVVKIQLQQLILNLIINGVEAISPDRGEIYLTTGQVETIAEDLEAVTIGEIYEDVPYVFVEVRDTGRGMDHATMERITSPFFTTKAAGHGLGLAVVADIVKNHQGVFRVSSEVGQGSTFTVFLPLLPH